MAPTTDLVHAKYCIFGAVRISELTYASVATTVFRVLIPGGIGFALSKNGVFPPTGPRIASMLILYCTLPALLFSKVRSSGHFPVDPH